MKMHCTGIAEGIVGKIIRFTEIFIGAR